MVETVLANYCICAVTYICIIMCTQELGVQILSDLQRQRETIVHSRGALAGVDSGISQARTILSTMSRRIVQNKIIMWGIIALLVGSIGLVLWKKL